MAGKPKFGLEYFSFDVEMVRDMKIKRLKRKHNTKGFAAFVFLLSVIYESGQYLKFNNIEDVLFSLSEFIESSEKEAREILDAIIELGLLHKDSFKKGYLTSESIQYRYYNATKRRKIRILDDCCLLSKEEMIYIDSKNVYKESIPVYKDAIDVYKDVIPANKNKQSNSNTNSKSNRDKRKINNDIGSVDPNTIPFKTNYYLQVLINNKIVKGTEEFTEAFNDYLYMITKNHNKDDVRKAIYYTIKRIEYKKWKDAEGFEVYNKEAYLEEAISNNINRNESTFEFKDRMSNFKSIFFNQ